MNLQQKLSVLVCVLLTPLVADAGLIIGGPRAFDFGPDGNLYFGQGPSSAFPSCGTCNSYEGLISLSAEGTLSRVFPVLPAIGPAFAVTGTVFMVGHTASGREGIVEYDLDGNVLSSFDFVTNNPAIASLGGAPAPLIGPNGNIFVIVGASADPPQLLVQEYTTSGTLVHETQVFSDLITTGGGPQLSLGPHGVHLSFGPDGLLHVASRGNPAIDYEEVEVLVLDENFDVLSTDTFSEVSDLRDFYINSAGDLIFASRIGLTGHIGSIDIQNALTGLFESVEFPDDLGIPLEIIEVPFGTSFEAGNYFVGATLPDFPNYGAIFEFDSNFNFLREFRGFEPDPFTVPEPGTLALLGIGLFGLGLARHRRRRSLNEGY